MSATLALLLGLAACTRGDMTNSGTVLPDGVYPLQIGTVSVTFDSGDGVQTRVTETADGSGSVFEAGDAISVSLNGETATYTFNGTDWTPDTQLYWTSTIDLLFAWYTSPRYTSEDNTGTYIDLSDQSEGLAYVLRTTAGFANTVDIAFTHYLAKVRVVFNGILASSDAIPSLWAPVGCFVNEGKIAKISGDGTISMYRTDYDGIGTCWEATVPGGQTISSIYINNVEYQLNSAVTTKSGSLHTITVTMSQTGTTAVDLSEQTGDYYPTVC